MAVILLHFGDRSRLVGRPDSWDELMDLILEFLEFPPPEIQFTILMTPDWTDSEVELDETAFEAVRNRTELTIVLDELNSDSDFCDDCGGPVRPPTAKPTEHDSDTSLSLSTVAKKTTEPVTVNIKTLTGKIIPLQTTLSSTVLSLKLAIAKKEGIPDNQQHLIADGRQLQDGRTLAGYKIQPLSTIHLVLKLRGDKPVITLLCPRPMDAVTVQILTSEEWRLTNLYPPRPFNEAGGPTREAIWMVNVDGNGMLKDQGTGISTPYLFWEAETVPVDSPALDSPLLDAPSLASPSLDSPLLAPPQSDPNVETTFSPLTPAMFYHRGLMLPMSNIIPYLNVALRTAFMDDRMCADFITHWLPQFREMDENNMDIAINWVPQAYFEKAAALRVAPAPDAVVRIFMIFTGVKRGTPAHDDWNTYRTAANPSQCRHIIGINQAMVDIMSDKTRFRVIEWGGMVVPNSEARV